MSVHHQQNQQEQKPHKDAYSCGKYYYIEAQTHPEDCCVVWNRSSQGKDGEHELRPQHKDDHGLDCRYAAAMYHRTQEGYSEYGAGYITG